MDSIVGLHIFTVPCRKIKISWPVLFIQISTWCYWKSPCNWPKPDYYFLLANRHFYWLRALARLDSDNQYRWRNCVSILILWEFRKLRKFLSCNMEHVSFLISSHTFIYHQWKNYLKKCSSNRPINVYVGRFTSNICTI